MLGHGVYRISLCSYEQNHAISYDASGSDASETMFGIWGLGYTWPVGACRADGATAFYGVLIQFYNYDVGDVSLPDAPVPDSFFQRLRWLPV